MVNLYGMTAYYLQPPILAIRDGQLTGFNMIFPLAFVQISLLTTIMRRYGTAQRQRRKCTQLFCELRVLIECNECFEYA